TPVGSVTRIGKRLVREFRRLGIETVTDLLFYFPRRHDDYRNIVSCKGLQPGGIATVKAQLELITARRSRGRGILVTEALLRDEGGSVRAVWFGQRYLAKILRPGSWVYLSGKVESAPTGLQFTSPAYELVREGSEPVHTARLVPVYGLTSGLTERQVRYLVRAVLPAARDLRDPLPDELRERLKLLGLPAAVRAIHFPRDEKELFAAIRRLKFDELFTLAFKTSYARRELEHSPAISIPFAKEDTKGLVANLPFRLTEAQRRAAWEILQDLGKEHPMNRLLDGDVGSGKTLVAAIAAVSVARARAQTAILAPTTLLARQHFQTFSRWLLPFGIRVGLLVAQEAHLQPDADQPPAGAGDAGAGACSRRDFLKKLNAGEIDLVIGTHALLGEKIRFARLALAVVDEQQRFGVEDRRVLREKGSGGLMPHLLSMTATPIPRTLALTFYGDLDVSLLNELPPGRTPVLTKLVEPEKRAAVYAFLRKEVGRGRQVFVVCPRIDPVRSDPQLLAYQSESREARSALPPISYVHSWSASNGIDATDVSGARSVRREFERLRKEVFPDFRLGMLHGRLKRAERERTMREFVEGDVQILVATSMIEVGIDVPNATVMMVEGAEQFGLAELHQFRGRVGRGSERSYCLLFIESAQADALMRLRTFVECNDGFALAEADLRFRGPGEFFGTVQSGFPEFRIASLRDIALMKIAREEAQALLTRDPELQTAPLLRAKFGKQKNGATPHLE
ncbi:MAG: ATP-dependent DNA helicase RecG, partial [Patescibacteria group bacterium]